MEIEPVVLGSRPGRGARVLHSEDLSPDLARAPEPIKDNTVYNGLGIIGILDYFDGTRGEGIVPPDTALILDGHRNLECASRAVGMCPGARRAESLPAEINLGWVRPCIEVPHKEIGSKPAGRGRRDGEGLSQRHRARSRD